eukprot:scaffold1518_cov417-Prasinococcus_capsulatus_cf.AAC.33
MVYYSDAMETIAYLTIYRPGTACSCLSANLLLIRSDRPTPRDRHALGAKSISVNVDSNDWALEAQLTLILIDMEASTNTLVETKKET